MPSEPLVLGIDCAAPHCAIALVQGHTTIAELRQDMARGQVEHLMPLIEQVLANAKASWHDLSAIGVGTGPGNFTGARIAVSAARGLALGLGIPAIGVTTLEAQTYGHARPCLALVQAPRDKTYAQYFNSDRCSDPLMDDIASDFWQAFDIAAGTAGTVIGPNADDVAARMGWRALPAPANIAVPIALSAQARKHAPGPRPAPLYLSPAAALPASDPAPVILD